MPDRDKDLVQLFVRDLDDIELPGRDLWRPVTRKESSLMKTSRNVLTAGAVAAVLLLALIASFALRDRSQVAATPTASAATATASPTASAATAASASPVATATASPTAGLAGAITGALGYPSEFIPPLTVYAISVTDQRVFFSVDTPQFGGGGTDPRPTATSRPLQPPDYTITGVTPGDYYVLAYRNDDVNEQAKNMPGVYSRYTLQCIKPTRAQPTATACPYNDHSLVPVTVRAGETVTGIEITDWYYQSPQNYPPRPR
jgi:hypothetical protein